MAVHDRHLDIVSVATMLATAAIGGDLAEAVGAYTVIIACGVAGSGYGLSRWRQCSRMAAVAYVTGWTVVAAATAVPAAELAAWAWPTIDRRWLIAPAAIIVSAIGHDWPRVIPLVLDRITALRSGAGASSSSSAGTGDGGPAA